MAAAALLRSVANKMARAPSSMHHRPLLARGGAAGSSGPAAGVSLPPPTSNEHARWWDRSVVSVAALRSLGTKLARAPPPPQQHRLLHQQRGLHTTTTPNSGASGFTPPPTSSKVFGVRDSELQLAYFRVAVAYITLFSGVIYLHGAMKELKHQVNTLSRERRILMDKIEFMEEIKAIEDMLRMQRLGAVLDGASEKGTSVKMVEKEAAEVLCTENNQIKELQALVATAINEVEERLEEVRRPENRDEELEAVLVKEFLPPLIRLKIALDRLGQLEGS